MGCSGPLGSASPSMVRMSAPSSCQAKTVQDFTAFPFTCTTQAPHCDVSQPTWVPVRRKCSRRNCTSRVRGSTSPVTALPFTVSATAVMASSSRVWPKASFLAPTGDAGGGSGQNRADFAPESDLEQVDSGPAAPGRSRASGGFLGLRCRGTSVAAGDRNRELGEEIVGGLLGRAVDQALAELGKLAADLRLHVVGEQCAPVLVGERHFGAALGKTGDAPLPFA